MIAVYWTATFVDILSCEGNILKLAGHASDCVKIIRLDPSGSVYSDAATSFLSNYPFFKTNSMEQSSS